MTTLSVPDMTCGHCKAAIERALTDLDPAALVAVDLAAREVRVTSTATPDRILATLAAEGYPATLR